VLWGTVLLLTGEANTRRTPFLTEWTVLLRGAGARVTTYNLSLSLSR
jgi:hypothetical protein